MAEGEAIRLLEFEALHHALAAQPHVAILGDFNSPSQSAATWRNQEVKCRQRLDTLGGKMTYCN